jgi:hypothetical protein
MFLILCSANAKEAGFYDKDEGLATSLNGLGANQAGWFCAAFGGLLGAGVARRQVPFLASPK